MLETRILVEDLEKAKKEVLKLGGVYKDWYEMEESLYQDKDGILKLRYLIKQNWSGKKYLLVKKEAEWEGKAKKDKIIFKKEFDTQKEADEFLKDNQMITKYHRIGWEYLLGNARIWVENIEGLGATIEVEGTKKEIENILSKITYAKILTKTVPEIMKGL